MHAARGDRRGQHEQRDHGLRAAREPGDHHQRAGEHLLLTEGQLVVANGANLRIVGANPNLPSQTTITAGNDNRVFEIAQGATVELSAVTVTGGRTADGTDGQSPGISGGSSADGGGILNKGSLTLDHVL